MGIALALVGVIVLGALAYLIGYGQGSRQRPADPPRMLRPCSCTHGLGGHDKDGCHHEDVHTVTGKPVILKDFMGNQKLGGTRNEVVVAKCGCRRFDGEVPPDLVGREWMGLGL